MQLGPHPRTGTEGQQPNRLAAAAQRQDEQPRAPILAAVGIAHHRPGAVIDLRLFAGRGVDHHARFRRLRAAQLAHESLHALVAAGKAVLIDQILLDGHRVAASAESQFDGFAVRFASAGAGTALWRPHWRRGNSAPSSGWNGLRSVITSESVITSLAGFEVGFAFPFVEGFSGLVLGLPLGSVIARMTGFPAPKSVITWLAGFAARLPQPPGGRTAIPAAFKY